MLRKTPKYEQIAFVASPAPEARKALARLIKRYGNVPLVKADVVVALGGDGLMLRTLHRLMKTDTPIYGMHRGTVGFLMNEFREKSLIERLHAAHTTVIHPLMMRVRDTKGRVHEHYAINEVSLFRQTYQVGAAVDRRRRPAAPAGADGRRRPGRDAGRLHRLQSLGAGADHPDRRAAARAHPDQPVPAAALARRAVAGPRPESPSA